MPIGASVWTPVSRTAHGFSLSSDSEGSVGMPCFLPALLPRLFLKITGFISFWFSLPCK